MIEIKSYKDKTKEELLKNYHDELDLVTLEIPENKKLWMKSISMNSSKDKLLVLRGYLLCLVDIGNSVGDLPLIVEYLLNVY